MTTATSDPRATPSDPFDQQASAALRGLRRSLAELVASVPGGGRRAADLQRALDIDYKLSWRVIKLLEANRPLAGGAFVPGSAAMKRFLKAAANYGVPDQLVESTRRAAAEFDRVVAEHAGDRTSFDSMVSAIAGEGSEQLDVEHKRSFFRSASHIYGIHARTHLTCAIFAESARPDKMDVAALHGYYDLSRLSPDASLMLSSQAWRGDHPMVDGSFVREPLDPLGPAEHGVSLLTEFCSQPIPEIRTTDMGTGAVRSDLVGNDVGLRAKMSCVLGHVSRNLGTPYEGPCSPSMLRVRAINPVPAEVLVHDVLISRDLFGEIEPELFVLGDPSAKEIHPHHEHIGRLRINETVTHLGRGLHDMHTTDVPRYNELLNYAFDRLGWDPEKFDVFRCRVQYPVMHSVVSMRFELPERAGGE